MKIDGINRPLGAGQTGGVRGKGEKPGQRFSVGGTKAPKEEPASVSVIQEVQGLFALQEVDDKPKSARQKAVVYGKKLLDGLENLRLQIISGNLSLEALINLETRLENRKHGFVDPGLEALIDDIELRVAVEIEKHRMATG